MGGDNDIFLAGDNALRSLAGTMLKNNFITFYSQPNISKHWNIVFTEI